MSRRVLIWVFGLMGGVLLAGCGSGSPLSNEVTVFINPGDTALAKGPQPDEVAIFGLRDSTGLPTSITEASFNFKDNGVSRRARVFFDTQDRLTQMGLDSGGSAKFEYVSATRVVITITSVSGKESAQIGIDLPAAVGQHVPGRVLPAFSNSNSLVGKVESLCGLTFLDADIIGSYATDKAPGTKIPISFSKLGSGQWEYSLPKFPASEDPIRQMDQIRRKINLICNRQKDIADITRDQVCQQLQQQGVPDSVLGPCKILLNVTGLVICDKLKAIANLTPKPSDNFANKYEVSVTVSNGADLPKTLTQTVNWTDTSIPTLVADSAKAGEGLIKDIVTNPLDPEPKQGYTITVDTLCAPDGTKVRIRVIGSDKYDTGDRDFTITAANPRATLSIPGGAAGVFDNITVKVLPNGIENFKRIIF